MGWFWADRTPAATAPHPLPRGNVEPPPGCPMHMPSTTKSTSPQPSEMRPTTSDASACPYKPPASQQPPQASRIQPSTSPSYISKLNPLNYMPASISNTRDSTTQTVSLPLDREASTIPRGDGTGTWEYPSPQQMYNAMLRKGYTDTPAEHVEAMVAVHNFLNEGAWEEIREWERRFSSGLGKGWEWSSHGEEGAARLSAIEELKRRRRGEEQEPRLVRFMGRPNEPTPKARVLGVMAYLFPASFADNPPFDRHDWFVQRQLPAGKGEREVRYVIDYYSGPPEPTGEPVFFLDVRPAVDGPTAACERLIRWGGDVWFKASGGSVRKEIQNMNDRRARR